MPRGPRGDAGTPGTLVQLRVGLHRPAEVAGPLTDLRLDLRRRLAQQMGRALALIEIPRACSQTRSAGEVRRHARRDQDHQADQESERMQPSVSHRLPPFASSLTTLMMICAAATTAAASAPGVAAQSVDEFRALKRRELGARPARGGEIRRHEQNDERDAESRLEAIRHEVQFTKPGPLGSETGRR